jgi:hypothetical protein
VKKVSQNISFGFFGLSPALHLIQFIRPDLTDFCNASKFSVESKSVSHNWHFLYFTISLVLIPMYEAIFVRPMVRIRLYKIVETILFTTRYGVNSVFTMDIFLMPTTAADSRS